MMTEHYTRLPGARRTPVSKHTLWMASDHLLVVHSNRVSERYQRVYFKDIQALIVEELDYRSKQYVWGGLTAMMIMILVILVFRRSYWWIPINFLMLLFPLGMLMTIAECRCYAQTALGRYRLGALQRNETLQNALSILTPRIMETQKKEEPVAGTGTPEML